MANYIADLSYLAIKEETTEGVAVKPTVFLPLESVELKTNPNHTPDRRMYGTDFEALDLSQGERSHAGTIKVWGDPDTLGHFLNMFLKKGVTTGSAGDGYTHPFTVENPSTYTVEFPKGDYAQRFFGVKGDELRLLFEEAKLKIEADVKAMGQVSVMKTLSALVGASDTVVQFSQEYDLEPNRGLAATDQLVFEPGTVNEETKTISSIDANGYEITLSAPVTNSHDAGTLVYLKKQTISRSTLQKPFFFGDVRVGFGATKALATTAAGSKATATPIHEFGITFKNNLLAAPTTNYRDPVKLLPQFKSCDLMIKKLFETPEQHQKWLQLIKQGICFIFMGEMINIATPTNNKFTFALHNAKLIDNEEPLNVGEYIMDEQNLKALYDVSDALALTVELVNETSTY